MSSKSEIKKPRLNVTRLNKCNIYFFAKIHVNEDLPDILKTTQHVLQFQGSVFREKKIPDGERARSFPRAETEQQKCAHN